MPKQISPAAIGEWKTFVNIITCNQNEEGRALLALCSPALCYWHFSQAGFSFVAPLVPSSTSPNSLPQLPAPSVNMPKEM